MAGRIIGDRYRIERRISKKAGRETVLAIDLTNWQQVILKILTFSSDFHWDDLKLFEREITTLQSLSHPRIPSYLGHFEQNPVGVKELVLVQSYINGRSLEDCLKSGRTFSEREIKQLAHALLEILIYIHSQHPPVIHRDIKPSNILLANPAQAPLDQVYLVDFGSVQTLAAIDGGTITIVGTYGYMPPEQFGGRTSPASDLYSLGTTLIHLVTGYHPADIPQTQLRLDFEPLTNLSLDLRNWLARLVEPGLRERFSSAKEALQILLQPPDRYSDLAALRSIRDAHPSVKKPEGTKILLLKQPGWIDILIPQVSTHPTSEAQSGYTRLYIDSQQISLFSPSGYNLSPSLRLAIVGIERHSSTRFLDCCLKILTTRQTYTLGADGSLSTSELEWLAYELSEWLGLPVLQR
jgi:serine/threonine protein kinase